MAGIGTTPVNWSYNIFANYAIIINVIIIMILNVTSSTKMTATATKAI